MIILDITIPKELAHDLYQQLPIDEVLYLDALDALVIGIRAPGEAEIILERIRDLLNREEEE